MTSPTDGATVTGTTEFKGQAGSTWVNVAAYNPDNGYQKVGADVTPSNGSFSISVDTTQLPNGNDRVAIIAFSVPAGQLGGMSKEIDITVDVQNSANPTAPSPAPAPTPTPTPTSTSTSTSTSTPAPTPTSALGSVATPIVPPLTGATLGTFTSQVYNGITTYILEPYNYSPKYSYPLLIMLHGVGSEIPSGQPLTPINGNYRWFNNSTFRSKFPAFIVAPQCEGASFSNSWGGTTTPNATMPCETGAIMAVQDMIARYSVNVKRVYVTGFSLGGIGTDHFLMAYPNIFAAGMPLAGGLFDGTTPAQFAAQTKQTPVWAFHGSLDTTVPLTFDRTAYADSQANGDNMKYTEFPNLSHDVWDTVYPDPTDTYWTWLFSQSKP